MWHLMFNAVELPWNTKTLFIADFLSPCYIENNKIVKKSGVKINSYNYDKKF